MIKWVVSGIMVYKIWAQDKFACTWCYDFFRETVDGVIFSYEMDGKLVRSAIIRVNKPIPQSMFDHYFLDYMVIEGD